MKSIWSEQTEIPEREPLKENIKVHTAVIGAGMAGILTAYFLKKEGVDVVVAEAKRIAEGQTKNTTAKITSQHGMIYDRLVKKIGREKAGSYAMANEDAIRLYERIIKEEGISCGFKKLPSFLYSADETRINELKREAQAAKELGISAHFTEGEKITELPFRAAGAVCFEAQAQFDPLAFIKHVTKDLAIYENTNVLSVDKHVVFTDKGNITAENIVFATHYPFLIIPGFYFLRQHQERSYVLALKETEELSGMYYGIDQEGLSFRSSGDILLLGGGAHRTGKQIRDEMGSCECLKEGFAFLRKMASAYYPGKREICAWAAQDCMTHDTIPFIGRYSVMRPYWYVATGFNKWGMTSSMVSAMIISGLIRGKESPYESVFTPQRFLPGASAKNLLVDIGQSAKGLSLGLFSEKERKCPHMGCRLEWNPEEESYDCPCHGSRFDQEGELLDGPAQTSLCRDER